MGIKKLSKFLISHNIVRKYNTIDEFVSKYLIRDNHNIKICIDASLYIHKYLHSYNDIIFGFINQIIRFVSSKIIPIYVFDGKPPKEKKDILKARLERKERINKRIQDIEKILNDNIVPSDNVELLNKVNKLKKQNININKDEIINLKKLLDILGLPYINANCEADIICAELTKNGSVHACLSDDMDLLAFGCTKIIRIIDGNIYEYDLNIILNKLNINYIQFVDMCILIGCDYIKNLKINPEIAYNYIIKYNNINNIDSSILHIDLDLFDSVKRLFIHNNINIDIDINKNINFNYLHIINFLKNNNYNNSISYITKYKYKINMINKYNRQIKNIFHHIDS
jgi:flap endonuclease-1